MQFYYARLLVLVLVFICLFVGMRTNSMDHKSTAYKKWSAANFVGFMLIAGLLYSNRDNFRKEDEYARTL